MVSYFILKLILAKIPIWKAKNDIKKNINIKNMPNEYDLLHVI